MEESLHGGVPDEVRRFVREHLNSLANASTSSDTHAPLNDVVELFLRGSLPPGRVPLAKRPLLKAEFVNNHFLRFSGSILSSSMLSFYSSFNEEQRKDLFDVFFLRGPSQDSLLVLGNNISKQTDLKHARIVVSLLEKFCSEGRFVDLFVEQSRVDRRVTGGPAIFGRSQFDRKLCGQLITLVVSLPQIVANKMKLDCSHQFYPDSYFKMLALQIVESLEKLHSNLSMSSDCSFKFLGELVGRICMAGQANRVFSILLPALEKWITTSPLWSRICRQLISGVPDTTMEHVAEGLLKGAQTSTLIAKLFGDSVLTNSKLKYLLTTKFLLMRSYANINILYNIIGYLSRCKCRHLLVETVHALFDVWGDKSAIKHTTYDQHFYVTCAALLSFGHMNLEERSAHKHAVLTKLLVGVQSHLDSPLEKLRLLGMVVAECVTSALESNGEKIAFEYHDNEDTKLLKSLAKGSRERADVAKRSEGDTRLEGKGKKQTGLTANPEVSFTRKDPCQKVPQEGSSDGDIDDDDDDLLPYDLSEEADTDSKPPKHLRDCIEGLVASDNPSKTEASLNVVHKLVYAELDDLEDVCVELVKVLLHLQDRYSTEKFCELRHNAMVSVTVRCPQQIASYLTEEFFAANYNLQQRMDMLNVLADAAQQLSAPKEISKERVVPKKFSLPQSDSPIPQQLVPEWQKIVQERINGKTRRLTKGPSHSPPKIIANKFAGVAGFFFFPLMRNFDSKVNTLDLLCEDSLVLGRLVYTLGIVIYSARETPVARNMGPALLEFTWALKYHKEPFVRQALIFAQAMVAVSVPSSLLMSDAPSELFELHDWLKTTVQSDVDGECVKAALQTLVLLEDIFKSQVTLGDR